MKTSFYVLAVVAVIGVIVAIVYLFPSPTPIDEAGVHASGTLPPVASAPPPVTPSPTAFSATTIPPVPPPNVIPAPTPVAPPPKPQVSLGDAIRLPREDRPLTNQTPVSPPVTP